MRHFLPASLWLLFLFSPASAQEPLPGGSEPLSKILKAVEQRGIQPVRAYVSRRHWIVEGIAPEESVRLRIEPRTAGIIEEEKIKDIKPINAPLSLSTVIHKLEEANPGPIRRIHFEKGYWKVETHRGKQVTELKIRAKDGALSGGRDE